MQYGGSPRAASTQRGASSVTADTGSPIADAGMPLPSLPAVHSSAVITREGACARGAAPDEARKPPSAAVNTTPNRMFFMTLSRMFALSEASRGRRNTPMLLPAASARRAAASRAGVRYRNRDGPNGGADVRRPERWGAHICKGRLLLAAILAPDLEKCNAREQVRPAGSLRALARAVGYSSGGGIASPMPDV